MFSFYPHALPIAERYHLATIRLGRVNPVYQEIGKDGLRWYPREASAKRDLLAGSDITHVAVMPVGNPCQLLPL